MFRGRGTIYIMGGAAAGGARTYLRWHVPLKCPDCIGDILILKLPELVIKYLDWNN